MITLNQNRVGNFTSSPIARLMSNGKAAGTMGKPAFKYIAEKNMERRLGRSIDSEKNARSLNWGKLVEGYVFGLLPAKYEIMSQETLLHPKYSYWAGSPDLVKHVEEFTTCDIKAPLTMESFCQLVDPLVDGLVGTELITAVRKNHEKGNDYYWQIVSNCILAELNFGKVCNWGELIVFAPYLKELDKIREYAGELDEEDQHKYYWLINALDEELPYLIEDGIYKNVNVIRFPIPEEDKMALTFRVIEGGKYLI